MLQGIYRPSPSISTDSLAATMLAGTCFFGTAFLSDQKGVADMEDWTMADMALKKSICIGRRQVVPAYLFYFLT